MIPGVETDMLSSPGRASYHLGMSRKPVHERGQGNLGRLLQGPIQLMDASTGEGSDIPWEDWLVAPCPAILAPRLVCWRDCGPDEAAMRVSDSI